MPQGSDDWDAKRQQQGMRTPQELCCLIEHEVQELIIALQSALHCRAVTGIRRLCRSWMQQAAAVS